jgi:hypothetical protein
MKLDVKAFALAVAWLWALVVLLMGEIGWTGLGTRFVDALGSVYVGYAPTVLGGIIGGVWGFLDGLVSGALFAWVYNSISARASRRDSA